LALEEGAGKKGSQGRTSGRGRKSSRSQSTACLGQRCSAGKGVGRVARGRARGRVWGRGVRVLEIPSSGRWRRERAVPARNTWYKTKSQEKVEIPRVWGARLPGSRDWQRSKDGRRNRKKVGMRVGRAAGHSRLPWKTLQRGMLEKKGRGKNRKVSERH